MEAIYPRDEAGRVVRAAFEAQGMKGEALDQALADVLKHPPTKECCECARLRAQVAAAVKRELDLRANITRLLFGKHPIDPWHCTICGNGWSWDDGRRVLTLNPACPCPGVPDWIRYLRSLRSEPE